MDSHTLLILIHLYPTVVIIAIGVLGLCIGSFLNLVIYRLPRMLLRDWHEQASSLLQACPTLPDIYDPDFHFTDLGTTDADTDTNTKPAARFNLFVPRSHCPQCQQRLPWWCNVPLVSFLLLRARCGFCRKPVSWRYPLVEVLAAILPMIVVWHLGFNWTSMAGVLLTWFLIVMTFIDLDHQLLPDGLTLSLIWLGLFLNIFNLFTTLESAVIGAIAGYLSLWLIAQLFYHLSGREGMGYGDFKLVSALGAWFGWHLLILIILLGSLIGAIGGISIHLLRRHKKSIPLPFGPYLALAGWICLCWGATLMQMYIHVAIPV